TVVMFDTDTHPSEDHLLNYVAGAAEDDGISDAQLKEHLSSCETCAARLKREAKLELALLELGERATLCPACPAVISADRCANCGAIAAIGSYRVERLILHTAHGRVYGARDGYGRPVALKELVFTKAPDFSAVDEFEREARILEKLAHP